VIENPEEPIIGGMSGSPILTMDGSAIGIVSTSNWTNPSLTQALPRWMMREFGLAFRSPNRVTANRYG
jgi:hypothetical protein